MIPSFAGWLTDTTLAGNVPGLDSLNPVLLGLALLLLATVAGLFAIGERSAERRRRQASGVRRKAFQSREAEGDRRKRKTLRRRPSPLAFCLPIERGAAGNQF